MHKNIENIKKYTQKIKNSRLNFVFAPIFTIEVSRAKFLHGKIKWYLPSITIKQIRSQMAYNKYFLSLQVKVKKFCEFKSKFSGANMERTIHFFKNLLRPCLFNIVYHVKNLAPKSSRLKNGSKTKIEA